MTYEDVKRIRQNPTMEDVDNEELSKMIDAAIEKQIAKKPYKRKEHKQNDYYCTVCNRYLGDDMELKHACLQPEYCEHCGQALDWGDNK